MKKLIVSLMLASSLAAADEKQDYCVSVEKLASTVMTNRQAGVSLSAMMELADTELIKSIVLGAYDTGRYGTDEYKERAITKYKNYWATICYKEMSK